MTHTTSTRISRAGFLAASAGLLLAACGRGSSAEPGARSPGTNTPADGGSTSTAASAAVPAGSVVPAPLVGASTIDGAGFDASTLAGRPTVAWFWAPWCVVCRGEAPDVAAIAAQYADRVNFIGVAGRGEAAEMRDFVSETGTGALTHLDDSSGAIWAAYEIYAQPAFAFITDDGRQETFTGALGADDLAQVIEQLLVA
ncbi:MAG: redoxin domain-containing protein [Actinobacteria bacterium]|nr:redoxin domain-containing protein [Actinomycetota bacterium]